MTAITICPLGVVDCGWSIGLASDASALATASAATSTSTVTIFSLITSLMTSTGTSLVTTLSTCTSLITSTGTSLMTSTSTTLVHAIAKVIAKARASIERGRIPFQILLTVSSYLSFRFHTKNCLTTLIKPDQTMRGRC